MKNYDVPNKEFKIIILKKSVKFKRTQRTKQSQENNAQREFQQRDTVSMYQVKITELNNTITKIQ